MPIRRATGLGLIQTNNSILIRTGGYRPKPNRGEIDTLLPTEFCCLRHRNWHNQEEQKCKQYQNQSSIDIITVGSPPSPSPPLIIHVGFFVCDDRSIGHHQQIDQALRSRGTDGLIKRFQSSAMVIFGNQIVD